MVKTVLISLYLQLNLWSLETESLCFYIFEVSLTCIGMFVNDDLREIWKGIVKYIMLFEKAENSVINVPSLSAVK